MIALSHEQHDVCIQTKGSLFFSKSKFEKWNYVIHSILIKWKTKIKWQFILVGIVRDNIVHFSFEQWQWSLCSNSTALMTLDDNNSDQSSISNQTDRKQMTQHEQKIFCWNDMLTEWLTSNINYWKDSRFFYYCIHFKTQLWLTMVQTFKCVVILKINLMPSKLKTNKMKYKIFNRTFSSSFNSRYRFSPHHNASAFAHN